MKLGDVDLYRYNLKGDPTTRIGVIAQELFKTHPKAVLRGDEFKPWMVDYGKLAPHLAAHLG